MKNPFPGMNPYLESRWGDVHTRLCAHISAALQPQLPRDLRARAEERIVLTEDGEPVRVRRGDALIVQGRSRPGAAVVESAAAVATPIEIEVPEGSLVHRWVQIVDVTQGGKVVTVIEVLSPWNKAPGRTNAEYVEKVEEYLSSDVNFVEIDLLRSSRRHLLVPDDFIPAEHPAPSLVLVNRPGRRATWHLYPMPLREPLPTIMVPCRATDPDVPLALQPLIDQIYVEGGHDDIDYSKPPEPPLSEEDRRWAASLTPAP